MCLIFILAILGLCCCTRGLSGCSVRGQLSGYGAQASRDGGSLLWSTGVSWWLLPVMEHGHLVVAAPCCGARASRGGGSLLWSTGVSWWRLPAVEHGHLVVAPCYGARASRGGGSLLWGTGVSWWRLPAVGHGLWGTQVSAVAAGGLRSCASRQLPHSLWHLPRPVSEPVSPASAGRFLTTGPPGKLSCFQFDQ